MKTEQIFTFLFGQVLLLGIGCPFVELLVVAHNGLDNLITLLGPFHLIDLFGL